MKRLDKEQNKYKSNKMKIADILWMFKNLLTYWNS